MWRKGAHSGEHRDALELRGVGDSPFTARITLQVRGCAVMVVCGGGNGDAVELRGVDIDVPNDSVGNSPFTARIAFQVGWVVVMGGGGGAGLWGSGAGVWGCC